MTNNDRDFPEYLPFEDDSLGSPMVAKIWRTAMEEYSQKPIKTRAEMIDWIDKHRDALGRHILHFRLCSPIRKPGSDSTVEIRAGDLLRDEN
tara:strand:- start:17815 stop:18090 length:276 start_codon:yes stop_codon:yes gene_type:complete